MSQHTAVIVGAGPGGGATAVRLLQRGVKNVVIVDKDEFPREKTCGSALSPNALKVVRELGIEPEVRRRGYAINSLVVRTPGKRDMKLTTEQAAIVLLRKEFDNLLLEKAKDLGVDFRSSWKALELVKDRGRVVGVRGKHDGKEEVINADYVIAADGAHSIFSWDQRPKRTISTLMGWWTNFDFEPGTMEMIFDKNLSPLYGWMFPETTDRVNIGICMEGEEKAADGSWQKTTRNVREVFTKFLDDHYGDRLARARQLGKFKGHPISYTTWIKDCTAPGLIYIGEGARITHNATGEGIFHAMQSGIYGADAVADIVAGRASEAEAWRHYLWQARQRFTFGFVMGHVLRGVLKTPLLDAVAIGYNSPTMRKLATWAVGSMLAGSHVEVAKSGNGASDAPTYATPPSQLSVHN